MAEWSIAAVLKTVVPVTEPGVRIPLSPLLFKAERFQKVNEPALINSKMKRASSILRISGYVLLGLACFTLFLGIVRT
jgi:hypothetical protein